MKLIRNPLAKRDASWSAAQNAILSDAALAEARRVVSSWPCYVPMPLVSLPSLASAAGIAALHLKDESGRFGIGSFKALGGAYAVAQVLARELTKRTGHPVSVEQATQGYPEACEITVTCATDGNHGRSVAWGAERFGCRAVIFIHETVSEGRRDAIARFGAEVRRVKGDYDDSVRIAGETAAAEGWHVVSDTSWDGYLDVPRQVMQGYEIMAAEAFEALDKPPTHIFLQTGVGGMAAAVTALAKRSWGTDRPVIVLADPDGAACWAESFEAGEPTAAKGKVETMQAGLACGEVSHLAWDILKDHADWVATVADTLVPETMRRLAHPLPGDPAVTAGESAVAGLIVLLNADLKTRRILGIDVASRVLVFSTEGDTDPELYRRIVGPQKSIADAS